jgi:serine protease
MSKRSGMRGVLELGAYSVVISMTMLFAFVRSAVARPRAVVSTLAQGHPYRHGVVPLLGVHAGTVAQSTASTNLRYQGGVGGAGVFIGAPRVYLVFWGSQWGSQAPNSQGDVTLSGDPMALAPTLQAFIKGLGTAGETWSGVMTQYCQGVSTGAESCSAGSPHVAYPSGGVLAGVWVDESSAAPAQATGHQIGLEAVSAATHFANTTPGANGNAQYVVVTPTGTHPDGFNSSSGQFCAWHDFTGDTTLSGGAVSSPYGQLAFTNLPYIPDAGTSCGQHAVNPGSAGALDGVTIVEGHEYAETLTDPYPSSGWLDGSGNENGDKCAWVKSGQAAMKNLRLSTGSFPVQSTWANDSNGGSGGCAISHPIVGN